MPHVQSSNYHIYWSIFSWSLLRNIYEVAKEAISYDIIESGNISIDLMYHVASLVKLSQGLLLRGTRSLSINVEVPTQ